ncbi:hypothetical protein LTR66_005285 [Elasticomyces elasticus]|nr:hypothetical protein LTR66_005285 [Elasticomyces elasticus]
MLDQLEITRRLCLATLQYERSANLQFSRPDNYQQRAIDPARPPPFPSKKMPQPGSLKKTSVAFTE